MAAIGGGVPTKLVHLPLEAMERGAAAAITRDRQRFVATLQIAEVVAADAEGCDHFCTAVRHQAILEGQVTERVPATQAVELAPFGDFVWLQDGFAADGLHRLKLMLRSPPRKAPPSCNR